MTSTGNRRALTGPATKRIAELLEDRKRARRWTYDDLIERTGQPRATIQRALGGTAALSVGALIPIALGMDLDPAMLIREGQEARRLAGRPSLAVVRRSSATPAPTRSST